MRKRWEGEGEEEAIKCSSNGMVRTGKGMAKGRAVSAIGVGDEGEERIGHGDGIRGGTGRGV